MSIALAALSFWAAGVAAADRNAIDRPGKGDWCYAPTRTLSRVEKASYIDELEPAASSAEAKWHVPAPVVLAMAIQESGYGTTRLAIKSNNVFAFKWPGAAVANGASRFVLWCQPDWDVGNSYIAFGSRAEALDFVASRLRKSAHYAAATKTYWSDIQSGKDRKASAIAWLASIAVSYNYKPKAYVKAIVRLANDPLGDKTQSLWDIAPAAPGSSSPVSH